MRKTILKSTILLAIMMLIAVTACAHPSPQADPVVQTHKTQQGDTVQIMSQAMGRNIKNVVIVPERYNAPNQQDERYPVLYLLHGAFGHYFDWSENANLDSLSNLYDVIIVCPDGQDSWYYDSPVDPTMRFETYISKELVAYIDGHYRTYANRFMRAITGLSMGGQGSLFLAWRHPDVFWSCGSMSGCMDITAYPDNWHIKDRLGEYADNKERWSQHTVMSQVERLKSCVLQPAQNIIIDDGLNDIFIKNNIALHELLLENGIDHDFTVRPGRHSWNYWVNSLDYHMVFFSKAFNRGYKLMNQ